MDRLEKFISENRDDFDKAVPDLKVWAAIDKELSVAEPPTQRTAKLVSFRRVLSIAASVLLLLFAGGMGGSYLSNQNVAKDINSLADVAPEYEETERFFHQQIQKKTARLASYEKAETVEPDLQQLDEVFKELTVELANAPKGTEDEIINAMIKNYQAKIDILNRVLEKVEEVDVPEKTINNEVSI